MLLVRRSRCSPTLFALGSHNETEGAWPRRGGASSWATEVESAANDPCGSLEGHDARREPSVVAVGASFHGIGGEESSAQSRDLDLSSITPQTHTSRSEKDWEWLSRAARASETRRASTMASSTEKGRVSNEASHAFP